MLFVLYSGSSTVTAHAEQTDTINATKIVNATKDKVWNIISDVDKYPDYWPITIVNSINTSSNSIERDVTVPAPPFMDNKAHQIITIIPGQSKVIENQTKGAVTGVKTISLTQVASHANETKINVVWSLDLSKIPGIGKAFAKDGIRNSVDEALNKIANASNG
jgi:carbon monoxide dehydrogenase subunit G